MKEEALKYLGLGFSIIPVKADKHPYLSTWKEYQGRRASAEEVEAWWEKWPSANIAIITGAISGIVVVDIEAGGSIGNLPATITARTGGQGWHLYYRHPGTDVSNGVRIAELTDIRGDGGYVLAPPSISSKGPYEWSVSFADAEMQAYPVEVIRKLHEKVVSVPETTTSWRDLEKEDRHEGARNDTATTIVGGLLAFYPAADWESEAWPRLQKWNQERCKPSLPDDELRRTFDSIKGKEEKKADVEEKEKSQVLRLMALIESKADIELFRDEYETAFIRVPVGDHKETLSCRSRKFLLWLVHSYLKTYGTIPQQGAVSLAIQAIEGNALFTGERRELHKRVAQSEEAVWYDLADEMNRAIRITPDGWDLVSNPPNLFQREKHMLAQTEPVRGGSVSEFLSFVNVAGDTQKILLLVYLVSCFIPNFPHPVLYLHGQKGSAKSTASKLLRKLVDPSIIEVVSLPKNARQAAQQLLHHHFIFYENVSQIPGDISDLLCIAVTGGGFEDREYYTNADAFIFNIKTNVGINGINISAVKPDLLERSILIELERISDKDRRKEQDLYAAFDEARPRILGSIFDTVSTAMKIRPSIKLEGFPRMADFAEWGCAIAEALGYKQSDFLEAYGRKIDQQDQEAIAASREAQLLVALMQGEDTWTGTPQALLSTLTRVAASRSEFIDKEVVGRPNILTRRLNLLRTNLLAVGIDYSAKKSGERIITIKRVKGPVEALESPEKVEIGAVRVSSEGSPPDDKGGQGDVF